MQKKNLLDAQKCFEKNDMNSWFVATVNQLPKIMLDISEEKVKETYENLQKFEAELDKVIITFKDIDHFKKVINLWIYTAEGFIPYFWQEMSPGPEQNIKDTVANKEKFLEDPEYAYQAAFIIVGISHFLSTQIQTFQEGGTFETHSDKIWWEMSGKSICIKITRLMKMRQGSRLQEKVGLLHHDQKKLRRLEQLLNDEKVDGNILKKSPEYDEERRLMSIGTVIFGAAAMVETLSDFLDTNFFREEISFMRPPKSNYIEKFTAKLLAYPGKPKSLKNI